MSVLAPLPIDEAVPAVLAALGRRGAAVVVSPPGSGKTTRLPPALLAAGLFEGACLVQVPRRIAARAAARRVAEEQGWQLGAEVGYEVRHDRRRGPRTRLVYLTDGILTAMLQADPSLPGVGAVLLDEFHERSLEGDLALGFLREVRESLRPDLLMAVLSATLEAEPVARFLAAEVVEAPGRPFPVEVRHLARPDDAPLPRRVAAGVRSLWAARPGGAGDLLAFLPGAGEIRRTAEELAAWAGERGVAVLPLHGDLPAEAQDAALRPAGDGGPRVILATNVAETSITVEGLTAVVDSGLAKTLRHDPASGLDRLELGPISRASADQRAGRAGRLGPGVCLRLWTRHEELSRPAERSPEVRSADLGRAVLEILAWGGRPDTFPWLEAPEPERLAAAAELLRLLGALAPGGGLTAEGEALRRLPLHPRLGRLALHAAAVGLVADGALLAALLAERDILLSGRAFGGEARALTGPSDLLHRRDLFHEAEAARFDPARLSTWGLDRAAVAAVARARDQIERLCRGAGGTSRRSPAEEELLRLLLAAYPDRVARRREERGDRFLLASGRGARLAAESVVRRDEFLLALRLDAGRRGERSEEMIRWASRIDPAWLAADAPLETRTETRFDADAGRVVAIEGRHLGALRVDERRVAPAPEAAARLLAEAAAASPLAALRASREAELLVARCRFLAAALPDLDLPRWDRAEWKEVLHGLALGKTSLDELRRADLLAVLRGRLSWAQGRALDQEAPERVEVPSGSRIALAYPEGGAPVLAVRIQEVFGWRSGPRVARGTVPVVLHLLGPHGRPLQVTSDLESFWRSGYPEVRKEMRGRYPRHSWPEDPWQALPSRRTTARPREAR